MGSRYVFSLQQEIGLQGSFGPKPDWLPPTDVYETEEEFIVRMELPGMEREEIRISFMEGILTIRGERRNELEASRVRYHQMEIRHGLFQRAICFPGPIAKDKIKAQYRQGLLKVVLPKR
ncbi:MAG: Hsp20/alpha crystallin family protein [Candidatus Acetothermia bacterium]|nr:Hsp20/alpha crystallin family protein [Candidatus Acetothermia bacterium]MDH7505709.1 Hsp20/alpha crystallin family protein [Candidatus Acetothermia bacterium]